MEKSTSELIEMYVNSLPEKELKAYHIAKSHLGSSFATEKSVGYLRWISKLYSV